MNFLYFPNPSFFKVMSMSITVLVQTRGLFHLWTQVSPSLYQTLQSQGRSDLVPVSDKCNCSATCSAVPDPIKAPSPQTVSLHDGSVMDSVGLTAFRPLTSDKGNSATQCTDPSELCSSVPLLLSLPPICSSETFARFFHLFANCSCCLWLINTFAQCLSGPLAGLMRGGGGRS